MSECEHCNKEKAVRQIAGKKTQICLNFECLTERMLAEYEGCNHNLEQAGDNLYKCTECNMGATPSYLKYP